MSDLTKDEVEQQDLAAERDLLANALRFEREKNKVLLDEVVALEDEVVNRCMADFDAVVSDETREFWREQLLSNREAASAALTELARAKSGGSRLHEDASARQGEQGAVSGGGRRPLHNRAVARPVPRAADGTPAGNATGAGAAGAGDDRAAKIRNRAHEISRAERVPFSTAFRRAERELGSV